MATESSLQVDYQDLIFSKKFVRKKIQLWDDFLYIRELNLINGALGGATWDGGVILARWIAKNGVHFFQDKDSLELGCGVGIGSCVAARFARKVVYTDFIEAVVSNASYNISANVHTMCSTNCGILDWNDVINPPSRHSCTRIGTDRFVLQDWYNCPTCFPNLEGAVCASCYIFHESHSGSSYGGKSNFKCDCTGPHTIPNEFLTPKSFDIIFGSELTYTPTSCIPLSATVDHYLKPNGVFYQVLSRDRLGVEEFSRCMEEKGFERFVVSVPEVYYSISFGTRSWSKQNDERYCFYTWKRADSPAQIMEDLTK